MDLQVEDFYLPQLTPHGYVIAVLLAATLSSTTHQACVRRIIDFPQKSSNSLHTRAIISSYELFEADPAVALYFGPRKQAIDDAHSRLDSGGCPRTAVSWDYNERVVPSGLAARHR
jgi:hypothetical protein